MRLHTTLEQILTPAYDPCQEFSNSCKELRWVPQDVHVPRGFLGLAAILSCLLCYS